MLLNPNRSSLASAPGEESKLGAIPSPLLLLSKSNAYSGLKSAASALLNMLSASNGLLSSLLSSENPVAEHDIDGESLFSDSMGEKGSQYGNETLADVVASSETSVPRPGGESRKLSSNGLVAAAVDTSEMKQSLSANESPNPSFDAVVDKGIVAENAEFKLLISFRLKSIVPQAVLMGLAWPVELSCLRPARLLAKYSQVTFRLRQREHAGFSLEHRTFDEAQPTQQSRSLDLLAAVLAPGLATPEDVGEEAEGVIIRDISNYLTAAKGE